MRKSSSGSACSPLFAVVVTSTTPFWLVCRRGENSQNEPKFVPACCEKKTNKSKPMVWTTEHDEMLCREILVVDPFTGTKKGTVARGSKWNEIAENLNNIQHVYFKVDKRAIRDRYNNLAKELKVKLRREEKETGIETDMTDLENALEELIEKEAAAESEQRDISDQKRKLENQDRENAEDIRSKAMERLGQTQKRKVDQEEQKPKKKRSNGNDTLVFLREKNGQEQDLRREELELKRKQLDVEGKRHDDMLKIMFNQQQQQQKHLQDFQAMMAKQQNDIMLALISISKKQ